jgi:hypothetical protein
MKELSRKEINAGANSNDRDREHTGKPKSGTNKRQKGSQLSAAGSASEEKVQRDNGLSVILGGGSPAIAGSSREQSTEVKSKTPNKAVQHARNEHVRRENGGEDTTGKR